MRSEPTSDDANGHLEFDFGSATMEPKKAKAVEKDTVPLEKDPTAVVFKAKVPPRSQESFKKDQPESDPSMSTTPLRTAVSAKQNIDRQRREQQAVGTILSGAATLVVIAVFVVAGLASVGGYLIYKEFQKQSQTVTQLRGDVEDSIAKLREETKAADQRMQIQQDDANLKINNLVNRSQQQDDQIKNLNATIEAQKVIIHRMDADLTQVKGTSLAARNHKP